MNYVKCQVKDLKKWFNNLCLAENDQQSCKTNLIEIHQRLQTLLDVGLGYLTLNRLANSLSGGESQRIQLNTQPGKQSYQLIIYSWMNLPLACIQGIQKD